MITITEMAEVHAARIAGRDAIIADQAAHIGRLEKACRAVINSQVDLGSAIRECHIALSAAALRLKEGE